MSFTVFDQTKSAVPMRPHGSCVVVAEVAAQHRRVLEVGIDHVDLVRERARRGAGHRVGWLSGSVMNGIGSACRVGAARRCA